MVTITIAHRHTGSVLHVISLPDTGNIRRDKFDALRVWRNRTGMHSTPVSVTATRTN